MWNTPTPAQLSTIPRLYQTELVPMKDKIIHCHFFLGGSDWYICEYDGIDKFFGFAVLNSDLQNAEWGYISFSELKALKVGGWLEVDFDCFWTPKPASEIDRICRSQGWSLDHLNN